jgi:hypothetical protein
MDSTSSKDSNGILFVNFRVTDQKIWILQVADDLKVIWIGTDPGATRGCVLFVGTVSVG